MGWWTERRQFFHALGIGVVLIAIFAVMMASGAGGKTVGTLVSDLGTVLAGLTAATFCARAALRRGGPMRSFWRLLAAACGAWTLGETVWTAYDLAGWEPPIPSWADAGYLSFVPLAAGAVASHPAMDGRRARGVLDGIAAAVALLFLSWTFVLGPLWWNSDLTTSAGLVTLAYPFGDVVLALVVVLAVSRMPGGAGLELWCLLGGVVAMAAADTAYAYVVYLQQYETGSVLDTGWFAAFVAIAIGAFGAETDEVVLHPRPSALPALSSVVAPFVPMLAALAVMSVRLETGHRPDGPSVVMALGLVLLVLSRQGMLAADFITESRRGGESDVVERMAHAALGDELAGEAHAAPEETWTRQPSEV